MSPDLLNLSGKTNVISHIFHGLLSMVQQTYKKVLNFLQVGTAIQTIDLIAQGIDNTTMGQTAITDANVPTGSHIKAIRVQYSVGNVGATVIEVGVAFQFRLAGQGSVVPPLAVGGNNQRNQVLKQWHFNLAPNEHRNIDQLIKIPKRFWRMKENMKWELVKDSNASRTESGQYIYKVRF